MNVDINDDESLFSAVLAYVAGQVPEHDVAKTLRVIEASGIGWRLYGEALGVYCYACQLSGVVLQCAYREFPECMERSDKVKLAALGAEGGSE